MIEVDITGEAACFTGIEAVDIQAVVAAVLDAQGIDHADDEVSLGVRLVDRDESAALNAAWREKSYATNVLSFPADVVLPGFRALGDLVICMPVVADEAATQGKSLAAHFTHMIVHGSFHLLGHDHIDDDEAEIMEAAERRVMAELGHRDPYALPDKA